MNYLSHVQPEDLKDKKVLVRLDLNVPVSDMGEIRETDADRIKASHATLDFLKDAGAKIIIISHIGRDPKESLGPVAGFMGIPLYDEYDPTLFENEQVIMLKNLRSNPGEEANDEAFARQLAGYADIYVNDAFAVSHRAHASLVGVPKFLPHYAGFQMQAEIEKLSRAFNPVHPCILVLGGAKFETKLPVISKFLSIVDTIIIGGALANNFYKDMGYEVGASLLDNTANIRNLVGNTKIIVPKTVVIENEQGKETKPVMDVVPGDKIVDAAPEGLEEYRSLFNNAKFILWNGPMGNYENHFTEGSEKIARMITESNAESIVGGGDSVALVEQLGLAGKFGFVSTGGGAMLEYLANGSLPAIDALE